MTLVIVNKMMSGRLFKRTEAVFKLLINFLICDVFIMNVRTNPNVPVKSVLLALLDPLSQKYFSTGLTRSARFPIHGR